jgi:hypothetical protein
MHKVSFTFNVTDAKNLDDAAVMAFDQLCEAMDKGRLIAAITDADGVSNVIQLDLDDENDTVKTKTL